MGQDLLMDTNGIAVRVLMRYTDIPGLDNHDQKGYGGGNKH